MLSPELLQSESEILACPTQLITCLERQEAQKQPEWQPCKGSKHMDYGSDIQGDQREGKVREGSPQEGVTAVDPGGPAFLLASQNRLVGEGMG